MITSSNTPMLDALWRTPNARLINTLRVVNDYISLPWCVVGGVAVSLYAERDPTDDVDILLLVKTEAELRAMAKTFRRCDYHADTVTFHGKGAAVPPHLISMVASDPYLAPIDLLATGEDQILIDAVGNARPTCWIKYPVIQKEHLVKMKRGAGRGKDIADLKLMG